MNSRVPAPDLGAVAIRAAVARTGLAADRVSEVVMGCVLAASHAAAPAWFSAAPVGAIGKLLDKVGWRVGDVDLYEINEAFAVVAMAAMHDLDLSHDRLDVHGGAPGARIVVIRNPGDCFATRISASLLAALARTGGRRGIAALCIGGGEATAIAVEVAPS